MSYIKVNNKVITASIYDIIQQLKLECEGVYFSSIYDKGDEIMFSCPYHKDGQEQHPSCSIHDNQSDSQNGIFHCFTCGASGTLIDLISYCLNINILDASEWLEERFGDSFLVTQTFLPEIDLNVSKKVFMKEEDLDQYKYIHPYVLNRGISEDIIKKFTIGCTPDGKYVTFPCWDEHNHLIGIFKRSTTGKEFIIPQNIDKPIYLLNFILNEHQDKVFVCESQFNALSLWTWGYPAIALFGTGSKEQYQILKKSGIRNFVLCFDGDEAGRKGKDRFIQNMKSSCFISFKNLPEGKDVNNLTKEEFDSLPLIDF